MVTIFAAQANNNHTKCQIHPIQPKCTQRRRECIAFAIGISSKPSLHLDS